MTDYPFDMQLVVDPFNTSNVVANGQVYIYAPNDTNNASPLVLTDPNGLALSNPLMSNSNGFLPPFRANQPQVKWVGAGFVGYFDSYVGLRDEAVAAKSAATTAAAAATAAAAQAQAPTDAMVDAGIARANLAGQIAAVVPSAVETSLDSVAATKIADPNSSTRAALNATIGDLIEAEVPDLITAATTGKLDKTEAATTYAKIPDVVLRARREGARAATPALAGLLRRFMAAKTTTWSDPNVWRVRALTKRGRRLVGVKHDDAAGLIIGYSDNDGGTWTQTYQFAPATAGRAEALIVLNDGEVLVAVRTNAGDYDAKIYKSTGFDSNPATATWAMVFDTPFAQATTVPHGMYRGLAYDGQDTVAGAWYDKKTLSGSTVYGDTAGVRVRRSLDKGVTWTEVFNLRTWLLGRGVAADSYGHHVHSITYDPFTDGWLLSYGDSDSVLGQSGILHFSKDFATITVLYYGTGPWQAVTMYALADCILTMGDGGTSGGVNRIPRKEDGTFGSFEKAYALDQAIGTGGYHASIGDFVIIPISQIGGTTPLSRILVTADGYTFHEFYVDTTYTVSSINGFQFAVGPTASGKIIATSVNDGRYAGSTSQLTITPS